MILAGYIGSWLMAGGLLAISAAVSALTKNQVIAFVLAAAICFLFLMSGLEMVQAFFRGLGAGRPGRRRSPGSACSPASMASRRA